jgi:hypothetical protein
MEIIDVLLIIARLLVAWHRGKGLADEFFQRSAGLVVIGNGAGFGKLKDQQHALCIDQIGEGGRSRAVRALGRSEGFIRLR